MGHVAQQLDRLQMGIEERDAGREGVHEHRPAAARENAARLAQAGLEIAPVMRRVATRQEIEAGVVERQMLGHRLGRFDIGESPVARGCRHRRQHLRRHVGCGHAKAWRAIV